MSMTHDEMIAVIAAHKEGKVIECRNAHEPEDWRDRLEAPPTFDFYRFDYRIKPEPRKPRVIYVNEYDHLGTVAHHNEASALEFAGDRTYVATRKFIEVIEDEESA